jgi:hypothetical protein
LRTNGLRLQAALLKVEEDGDLHIALHDVTGDKPGVVVCEIPAQLQWCDYHNSHGESDVGRRPCTERSKQPSKVHAGLPVWEIHPLMKLTAQ